MASMMKTREKVKTKKKSHWIHQQRAKTHTHIRWEMVTSFFRRCFSCSYVLFNDRNKTCQRCALHFRWLFRLMFAYVLPLPFYCLQGAFDIARFICETVFLRQMQRASPCHRRFFHLWNDSLSRTWQFKLTNRMCVKAFYQIHRMDDGIAMDCHSFWYLVLIRRIMCTELYRCLSPTRSFITV